MNILPIIEEGRNGHNKGLLTGITGFDKATSGIIKGRYYLIGADSGVGKTTITDYLFVLNLFKELKKNPNLKIFYYSWEISKEDKISKWLSYLIYEKYCRLIDCNYIMGRKKIKLTDEEFEMVQECHSELQEYLKQITICDDTTNPTGIFKWLIKVYYDKYGNIEWEVNKKDPEKKFVKSYTQKIKDEHVILVVDHLSLIDKEQSLSTKQAMDKASRMCVRLKNLFKTTIVMIQQFNTDYMSYKRDKFQDKKSVADELAPQKLDFGDSKSSFNDADFVIGLIKPYTYKIKEVNKWDISELETTYVSMYLIKNRYGQTCHVPLFVNFLANHITGLTEIDRLNGFIDQLEVKRQIEQINDRLNH